MNLPEEILNSSRWTIEAVEEVTGLAFEKIICDFYGREDALNERLRRGCCCSIDG